jgi:hypothetical protein
MEIIKQVTTSQNKNNRNTGIIVIITQLEKNRVGGGDSTLTARVGTKEIQPQREDEIVKYIRYDLTLYILLPLSTRSEHGVGANKSMAGGSGGAVEWPQQHKKIIAVKMMSKYIE